jgi:translation initiation factor IF-1
MTTNKDLFFQTQGKIKRRLKNNFFQVECNNGEIIIADIATRSSSIQGRKARVTELVEGKEVVVKISLKDLKKGQIISLI